MEQTEFHYLITFSKLFLKLGMGQDTSEECAAIKSFSEDDQFDIVQQLMERLTEHGIQFAELIVSSIKAIGLLDENYVDDFFQDNPTARRNARRNKGFPARDHQQGRLPG